MPHILTLNRHNRNKAVQGVVNAPDGYVLELREPRRSDEQNRALWSLLNQVQRQRPTHRDVVMTPELWKAVFMHAAGVEGVFLPALEGGGLFPAGFRSSRLSKSEFASLLEIILAWTAREGLQIEHFDDTPSEARTAVQLNAKNVAAGLVRA